MTTNRLPNLKVETAPGSFPWTPAGSLSAGAFLPCPAALWQAYSLVQKTSIQALYRLALEQAQAQVSQRRRHWLYQFSLN